MLLRRLTNTAPATNDRLTGCWVESAWRIEILKAAGIARTNTTCGEELEPNQRFKNSKLATTVTGAPPFGT